MLLQRSPSKVYQTKLFSDCQGAPAKEPRYAHAYKWQNHAPAEEPIKGLPNKAVQQLLKSSCRGAWICSCLQVTKQCSSRGAPQRFTKQNCLAIAQKLLQRSLDMLRLTNNKTMLLQRNQWNFYQTKLFSNCLEIPAEESRYGLADTWQNHAPAGEAIIGLPSKTV